MTSTRPFARLLFAAALSAIAVLMPMRPAHANDYSDVWITQGEGGWGVSILQWGNTMFASFFVYGPDSKPTWYVAVMSWDGVSKYSGTLYAERGTYFALPWVPSDQIETVAGTALFQPSALNNFQGQLIYTVNNGASVITVQKAVERLTVVSVPLAGTYFGGQSGAYSGCTTSANNTTYFDHYKLVVTQTSTTASLNFQFTSNLTCTISGTVSQNGQLYSLNAASYLCSNQLDTTAFVSDLKITAQGIEGVLIAPNVGGACREDARFSAVRN